MSRICITFLEKWPRTLFLSPGLTPIIEFQNVEREMLGHPYSVCVPTNSSKLKSARRRQNHWYDVYFSQWLLGFAIILQILSRNQLCFQGAHSRGSISKFGFESGNNRFLGYVSLWLLPKLHWRTKCYNGTNLSPAWGLHIFFNLVGYFLKPLSLVLKFLTAWL